MAEERRELQLSADQQLRLWHKRFMADVRELYFADLATRYREQQRWFNICSVILSSAALISFTNLPWIRDWNEVTRVLLTLGSTVLSAFSLNLKNHERVQLASELQDGWAKLALDSKWRWDCMYDEDSCTRLREIEDRAVELSRRGTGLPLYEKKMLKWQKRVEKLSTAATATRDAAFN